VKEGLCGYGLKISSMKITRLPPHHPTNSHTQDDFVTAWKAVMYAKTPEDCEARWNDLSREFHKQKCMSLSPFLNFFTDASISSIARISLHDLPAPSASVGTRIHKALPQLLALHNFSL
jgi:hypothetical protein